MQDIRQIRILCQETEIIYTLNDSQAATELYNQLPLEVPVENFSHNEKIFYPLESLDTSDAPLASGGSGILAYYAPWQDVVLFTMIFRLTARFLRWEHVQQAKPKLQPCMVRSESKRWWNKL